MRHRKKNSDHNCKSFTRIVERNDVRVSPKSVPGHSGVEDNEIVDARAGEGVADYLQPEPE